MKCPRCVLGVPLPAPLLQILLHRLRFLLQNNVELMHRLSGPEDDACPRNLPLFVEAQTQEGQASGMWNRGRKRVLMEDFSIHSFNVLYSCFTRGFFVFLAVILHVSLFCRR